MRVQSNISSNIHKRQPALPSTSDVFAAAVSSNRHPVTSKSMNFTLSLSDAKSIDSSLTTHTPASLDRTSTSVDSGVSTFSVNYYEEIEAHLFTDNGYLANCISSDVQMSDSIALSFAKLFPQYKSALLESKPDIGSVIIFDPSEAETCGRIYLVTKQVYSDKPTMSTLKNTLISMYRKLQSRDINRVSMPRIGCGLDKLDWDKVSKNKSLSAKYHIHTKVFIYDDDSILRNLTDASTLDNVSSIQLDDVSLNSAIVGWRTWDGVVDVPNIVY